MIKKEPTLNIILDDTPNVVIVPVILDKGSTAITRNIGRLEYQVSDGMAGSRGMSYDAYTWADAKKYARELQNK